MDNSFVFEGTLHQVYEEQKITDKFLKREFIVRSGGDYPQTCIFQTTNKMNSVLDMYNVGQKVRVTFTLQGKLYEKNGKYYNSLSAQTISLIDEVNPQQLKPNGRELLATTISPPAQFTKPAIEDNLDETDDLPF